MFPWFQRSKDPSTESSRVSELQRNNNAIGDALTTDVTTAVPCAAPMSLSALVRQSAVAALADALRAVPPHEKLAYLEATQLAPHVVETESDPLQFLRFAGMDARLAVQRLLAYWRKRKHVFGPSRAFLPLNLTGSGALNPQDIELVLCGSFALLRNDSLGHSVMFIDRSREPVHLKPSVESRMRVTFFFTHELMLNPNSQADGCVMVVRPPEVLLDKTATHEMAELLRTAIPIRIKAIHMVYYRQNKQNLLQYVLPYLMEHVGRFFSSTMIVHNCGSVDQIVQKLATHGLNRESLPDYFGGTWTHVTDFAQFLIQHGLPATLLAISPSISGKGAAGGTKVSPPGAAVPAPTTTTAAPVGSSPTDVLGSAGTAPNRAPPFHLPPAVAATSAFRHGAMQADRHMDVSNGRHKNESPTTTTAAASPTPYGRISNQDFTGASAAVAASGSPLLTPHASGVSAQGALPFRETPDISRRGLASLNDALAVLPDQDKAAYLEALRRVPHLVQKESNPLLFLRFEKFNAWAAAQRLALYWKNRLTLFQDRAFLPFDHTGRGAIEEADINIFGSGYAVLLAPDASGRSVLAYDPSKRREDISITRRMKIGWYMYQLMLENKVSQKDSYVLLLILGSPGFDVSKLDTGSRAIANVVLDSFPMKEPETHVIYSPSQSTPQRSFMTFVLPVLLNMLGRLMKDKAHFHVGVSHLELQQKLLSFGLSRAGLPEAIGGEAKDGDFLQSIRARGLLESSSSSPQQALGHQPPVPPVAPASAKVTSFDAIAERAVQGTSAEFSQDPQAVEDAMKQLPQQEKEAYLEAMKKVPDIVKKESNPVSFLRTENYNAVAAAKRLAAYWRIRREVFSERAFLPMDQTTDGGLNRRDVAVLQTGYLMQLPHDAAGRSVLFCDGTRLQKSSRTSQLRCFFYMWSVVAENECSRTDGFNILYTMTEPSFDRACKECLDRVIHSIPVKVKCFHLLGCRPEAASDSDFHNGPVRATIDQLDRSIQDKVVVHVCESRGGFARKLSAYGMSRDGLPKALGGNWGFQEFVQWQELRIRREWDLPIGSGMRDAAESYHIPVSKVSNSLDEEGKSERKRRMNVIHSRRKRERERVQVEGLHEQCFQLKEKRIKLTREGRKLEALLEKAEAEVSKMHHSKQG